MMFSWKTVVGHTLLDSFTQDPCRFLEFHPLQFLSDLFGFAFARRCIFLGMDRLEHCRDLFAARRWDFMDDVLVKVEDTSLPRRLREELRKDAHQSWTLIGNDQASVLQPALLEVT